MARLASDTPAPTEPRPERQSQPPPETRSHLTTTASSGSWFGFGRKSRQPQTPPDTRSHLSTASSGGWLGFGHRSRQAEPPPDTSSRLSPASDGGWFGDGHKSKAPPRNLYGRSSKRRKPDKPVPDIRHKFIRDETKVVGEKSQDMIAVRPRHSNLEEANATNSGALDKESANKEGENEESAGEEDENEERAGEEDENEDIAGEEDENEESAGEEDENEKIMNEESEVMGEERHSPSTKAAKLPDNEISELERDTEDQVTDTEKSDDTEEFNISEIVAETGTQFRVRWAEHPTQFFWVDKSTLNAPEVLHEWRKEHDELWEVEAIVGETRKKYKVKWAGEDARGRPWKNTMEPKENVPLKAVREWEQLKEMAKVKKADQAAKPKRGRKRKKSS